MNIDDDSAHRIRHLRRLHLLFGWSSLLLYSLLGVGLEVLLAYKVSAYVDWENESRRLMWRLAHAHGTLFAVIHLGFSATVADLPRDWSPGPSTLISWLLTAAALLIPVGFFLAGLDAEGGDPGAFIALVPTGALAFSIAAAWTGTGLLKRWRASASEEEPARVGPIDDPPPSQD